MEVNTFYWFAKPEDFDETGALTLDISAGRLRHRWVPAHAGGAKIFLRERPEAEGLRQSADHYIVVEITVQEALEDLAADYPNALVRGLRGYVIRTPFREVVVKQPSKAAQRRGVPMPPISYRTSQSWLVETYPTKQVGSIDMGLLTEREIIDMSTVEITSPGAFQDNNPEDKQTPVLNGVHDLRMGSMDTEDTCQTCFKRLNELDANVSCQGHFGRVTLAKPVPKLQFLGVQNFDAKGTYPIMHTLNSVCFHCSRILLPQSVLDGLESKVRSVFEQGKRNYSGYSQIRNMLRKTLEVRNSAYPNKKAPCPHCDEFTPKIKFSHTDGKFYFPVPDQRYVEGARNVEYDIPYLVLKGIRDEDCIFLGMDYTKSRPEDLFFTVLPVSPNITRPQRVLVGKKQKELSDLTKLYQDVVYSNNELQRIMLREVGREAYWTRMLYHSVSRIFDNQNERIGSGGTMTQRGYGGSEKSVSFKGIMNRLEGKRGRFRNNLQSKYAEQVSYSIITPNAALAIDEVGVPKKVAMTAHVQEKVTEENYDRILSMIVENGSLTYPGVRYIIEDGDMLNKSQGNYRKIGRPLNEEVARKFLSVGSKVLRHVMDGDIGLFNRAPSLHRQSILGMRAKILEAKSLAMNPTICIPFNADYDGDAMKLHFVQSPEAIDEAKRLLLLTKNIVHARYGKLTVATDQDQTSGLYLLTHTDKRRRNEWNPSTGLGFTDEGIPYFSKEVAIRTYTYVFSEIRDEQEKLATYKKHKKFEKLPPYDEWSKSAIYRTIDSLPESDYTTPSGEPAYTGRAIFSHLFTVLDCEYVSATFEGNSPAVDDSGLIQRSPTGKKKSERIIVYNGKLLKGTLEKDSFGEGGASLAPAFMYNEGYDKGQAKLVEFIEMVTRLGYAGHHSVGYTMGVGDVGVYDSSITGEIDRLYDEAASKIAELQQAYYERDFLRFASNETERILSIVSPADFIEEKIVKISSDFEDASLRLVEDYQGSGNSMQIAVRSKARGKDENVRQMGGAYGIVLVGGRRILHGVNPFRAFPHSAEMDFHPRNTGFVRGNYSRGMNPMEYWQTSSAGRRAAAESSMGGISESGYLERKMIKAMECMVVNDKRQVVNIRTGRVLSPLVGGDGLAPYHIRGSHKDTNKDGHTLTLQPLLMKFNCRHGKPLESAHIAEFPEHECKECSKDSKFEVIEDTALSLGGFVPSKLTLETLQEKMKGREVLTADLRKIGKSLHEFHNECLCRPGEAIGATAGGCIGEPATQAALRTFHFAGKLSFQGSVGRLRQLLESPVTSNTNIKNPQVTVMLKEGATEETANRLAAVCREIVLSEVVELIEMNPKENILKVHFNEEKINALRLGRAQAVFANRISSALSKPTAMIGGHKVLSESLSFSKPFTIRLVSEDRTSMMRAKESILAAKIAGITSAKIVSVIERNGRYGLDIREASIMTMNSLMNLDEFLDFSTLKTNNLGWIYTNFGLEAMLEQWVEEMNFQMNGGGGAKGVGEYDVRYIRSIADLIGETGEPLGLGPKGEKGLGSPASPSPLAGMSVENVKDTLLGGALMGVHDELNGPAESVITGSVPLIGDYAPKAK